MKEGDRLVLSGMADEIKIVDANGELITTLYDIENELPRDVEIIDKTFEKNSMRHSLLLHLAINLKFTGSAICTMLFLNLKHRLAKAI